MIGFSWSLYSDTIFFWCGNTKYLELFKKWSKVHKNNVMWTCFKFWQWKPFFGKYKPMIIWLWLVYKFTVNYCRLQLLRVHSDSKETSYLSWQNAYSNLKTIFLKTIFLKNVLLVKYLISVAAPLKKSKNQCKISLALWEYIIIELSNCFKVHHQVIETFP